MTGDEYVIVTYLVTNDGEQGHPMDTCAVRVDIDEDGHPTFKAMERLGERVARDVARKVAANRARQGPQS